ncbi:MAG: leucyl aminopeptidase family protein [Xanthobacteraceae bacterium]
MSSTRGREAKPIWCVDVETWPALRDRLPPAARAFADAAGFKPETDSHLLLPGDNGAIGGVLFSLDKPSERPRNPFLPGKLATILPAGTWRFESLLPDPRLAALAFALGAYRFTRYRKSDPKDLLLELPAGVDGAELTRVIEAVHFVRDLVNTPSNDCGPAEIEATARVLAEKFGASVRAVVGDELLKENFPLVHAVGRASARAPRLIDLAWGNPKHPKVSLVGKGVVFDTGGLDIKPSAGMLLMKKDMGGAAHALGLAQMIMDAKLPVRLRVVIPAVENAISGDAFRPGDVFASRKGVTVEIGNTDAEGRLILADALAFADEDTPELIVDFATLTGSARVALGPELPAMFTDDDELAGSIARHAAAEADPSWRMPLWRPYQSMLESKIADTNNVGTGTFAGAITAALFLARFVERAKSWVHFDLFAWNPTTKPGRPEGGEAQTIRALHALLCERYR